MTIAVEPNQLERLLDRLGAVGPRSLPLARPVADVGGDIHVRKQGVLLKDRVHVPPVGGYVRDHLTGDPDVARCRPLETGDHPQKRRLAAPGRTEQREERPGFKGKGHVVDGPDVAKVLDESDRLDVSADIGST